MELTVKCVTSCDTDTHIHTSWPLAIVPRHVVKEVANLVDHRVTGIAVYLDQCYGKHLMCSASNVYS